MSTMSARLPASSGLSSSLRTWLERVLHTDGSSTGLIARVVLGAVLLPHGAQKVFGAFGGYGFSATMAFFTENLHIPAVFALLAILAESLGAVALVLGLFGRVGAFGIGTVMAVAAFQHLPNGFFMNWFGNQKGEGFEFHLLAIALAAVVVIRGSGALSVDRLLTRGEK